MTHDVEKRFDRPGTFHEAAMYVGVVVAVAGVVFAIYASTWKESVVVASMVPGNPVRRRDRRVRQDLPGVEGRGRVAGVAGRGVVPAHSDAGVPVHSRRGDDGHLGHDRIDVPAVDP